MKKMLCIALVGLVSAQVQAADNTVKGQLNPITTAEADSSSMAQAGLALIPMLTQSLGVTEAQATGGMGSIFQAVQGAMSTSDFNSLSKAVPNMDSLLSAAPAVDTSKKSGGSLLSGAMDAAAQYGANTKVGAQLVSQFNSLGLSPDMISKFADVATNYLKKGEVPQTADLLSTALSTVLK
jgi:hypothetical protein